MTYDFGNAEIVLVDGSRVSKWKEYTIDSDFLTPTDGWSFTFGTEVEWKTIRELTEPGLPVQILVNGAPQLTGWIDSQRATCAADGGTTVTITGRDYLMPLVKSNVHPSTRIKSRTVAALVEAVVRGIYQTANQTAPKIVFSNKANQLLLTSKAAKVTTNAAREANASKLVEYCQPHVNESAFEFLARNLRRFGLWIWATADGTICVSGPDYKQGPSYQISRKRGDRLVHVLSGEWTFDKTNVPSHIFLRGKTAAKEWDKQDVRSNTIDPDWLAYKRVFCPMFIQHDEATTNEQADLFAMQEMSRLRQDERVYQCSLLGHSDPRTGAVYALDTVAHVEDEILGVSDDFYVTRRTFHKSVSGGTTTDLKLVPLGSIMFSDADSP